MSVGDETSRLDVVPKPGAARPAPPPGPIEVVVVIVPARNEQDRVEACLTSLDVAAAAWGGPVVTVVAADSCTDRTATIVAGFRGTAMSIAVVEGEWRRPSRARRAAVDHALALAAGSITMDRVWIASTDADCTVEADWITRQVAAADRGRDVVAGVVALDPSETPFALQASFTAHYQLAPGDRHHVHAANLGIRAACYRAVGGWRSSTAIGEEHHLVRAAGRHGARISWADDLVVRTSSRTTGRVRGGFASVLNRLERGVGPIADSA